MKVLRILLFFLVGIIFIISGCSDGPTEINNYYYLSADSLSNPNIKPQVIFVSPANGAVGPLNNLDPEIYPTFPKITIQFNKLINIYEVGTDDIFLQWGEHNVPLELINRNNNTSNFLTNILIFYAHEFYLAKKTYKLLINKSLKDVHGYSLEKPYEVSFLPEPEFRIIHVFPTSEDVEPMDFVKKSYRSIQIMFNSKIDSNIIKHLSISPTIKGYWSLTSDYYSHDSISVYFYPEDTLKLNTQYTVSISNGARDSYGNKIKNSYSFTFKTSPFTVKWYSNVGYTGPNGFYIYNDFTFKFNAPVDTASVRKSLSVSPAIQYYIHFPYSSDKHYYKVNIDLKSDQMQPNTIYSIKFNTKLKSIHGDYLQKPYVFSFKTGG
ncbi:Ig-like domain-containing domain [Calditrichota bacterium LG25]